MVGNTIQIINKVNGKKIHINTLSRELLDSNVPTLRMVPVGYNEFIVLTCVVRSVNNHERIFWEYEVGQSPSDVSVGTNFIGEFVNVDGSSGGVCN